MAVIYDKKIVCLGGGIGSVNLVKGLRSYTDNITIVVSLADDGGSSGRLRRLYNIPPMGDVVSCVAALAEGDNPLLAKLLTYRFPGDRYGRDDDLAGHKLGNLIMVALSDIAGGFNKAIPLLQEIFDVDGHILPATNEKVSLSAQTVEGKKVHGEEAIDLGKYEGERILDRIFIDSENDTANEVVLEEIEKADILIAGPGDLYSTLLPVLIIPGINEAIQKSSAEKFYIVNVANKPFETTGYTVADFISAIEKHLGTFPFTKVISNNNFSVPIPAEYNYSYVQQIDQSSSGSIEMIEEDIVDESFPLYHNSAKLATAIVKHI